jgi:post-segregation antitoxin (ccd killing protein)
MAGRDRPRWIHGQAELRLAGLALELRGCIVRRMPRMQVYLPDDLYELVKARGLPASELLQKAVRAELRRLDLLAETERYVEELVAEVGPPAAGERARAGAVARRVTRRPTRQVG